MQTYKLRYTMRGPCEDTEDMYLAEIPALPGCRAWGETEADAVDNLRGVAAAFIASYRDWGDELPGDVEASSKPPRQ